MRTLLLIVATVLITAVSLTYASNDAVSDGGKPKITVVGIKYNGVLLCSGTLLRPNWVLTSFVCRAARGILSSVLKFSACTMAPEEEVCSRVSHFFQKKFQIGLFKLQNNLVDITSPLVSTSFDSAQGALIPKWVIQGGKCVNTTAVPVVFEGCFILQYLDDNYMCADTSKLPLHDENIGAPLVTNNATDLIGIYLTWMLFGQQHVFAKISPYINWIQATMNSKILEYIDDSPEPIPKVVSRWKSSNPNPDVEIITND